MRFPVRASELRSSQRPFAIFAEVIKAPLHKFHFRPFSIFRHIFFSFLAPFFFACTEQIHHNIVATAASRAKHVCGVVMDILLAKSKQKLKLLPPRWCCVVANCAHNLSLSPSSGANGMQFECEENMRSINAILLLNFSLSRRRQSHPFHRSLRYNVGLRPSFPAN